MAQTKYLDLTGLTYFWEKAKSYIDGVDIKKVDKTTKVNNKLLEDNITLSGEDIVVGGSGTYKASTVQTAIDELDAAVKAAAGKAVVTSFGSVSGDITINAGAGNVNFTMSGNNLVGNVDLSGKADKSHTHNISDVTGLDTALAEKATKTIALKEVTGAASTGADKVTITINTKTESDTTSATNFDFPVADESNNQGTTTLGKIREIAKSEAATAAGSTYRVKGTKATIDEVLAVGSAVVGDTYNVTAEFTLNSKKYPAGTNVVFIGDGTPEGTGNNPADQTQWDALGGTVDLSPYATTEYVNAELGKKANATEVVKSFGGLSNSAEITLKSDSTTNGEVNFSMSGSELQGTVYGLKSAAFTDLIAITNGEIDAIFAPQS